MAEFLALMLLTSAIVADLLFNLEFGFEVRDLKTAGMIGLIWIGIYVGSRIVDHLLDGSFERR